MHLPSLLGRVANCRKILLQVHVHVRHSHSQTSTNLSLHSICDKNRLLSLSLNNKDTILQYPLAWLRNNCQCPSCFNHITGYRKLEMQQFNPKSTPVSVKVETSQGLLQVEWDDKHESKYPISWLLDWGYSKTQQPKLSVNSSKLAPKLWLSEPYKLEFEDFNSFMNDDKTLLKCLLKLETSGLVFLNNSGTNEDVISKLCYRIAYPRRTHYGETFRVESKDNPSNVAYTSGDLGFHTDLPYFSDQPNLQVLHCTKQTTQEGGVSIFSDGFSAAEELRKNHPKYFKILTEYETHFRDKNKDALDKFYVRNQHPIIELDKEGTVTRIHYSNQQRDSITSLPLNLIQDFYNGLKVFNDIFYNSSLSLQYKMKDGELVLFENGRILHGRSAYTGDRLFIGAYLNWEETLSRRRVLQHSLTTTSSS